ETAVRSIGLRWGVAELKSLWNSSSLRTLSFSKGILKNFTPLTGFWVVNFHSIPRLKTRFRTVSSLLIVERDFPSSFLWDLNFSTCHEVTLLSGILLKNLSKTLLIVTSLL